MSEQIKSIQQLKELAGREGVGIECSILLNGGLKSTKDIFYTEKTNMFEIFNYIDNTTQLLSEAELFTNSNIGLAITKGALIID